jgi:hypothetical protein
MAWELQTALGRAVKALQGYTLENTNTGWVPPYSLEGRSQGLSFCVPTAAIGVYSPRSSRSAHKLKAVLADPRRPISGARELR